MIPTGILPLLLVATFSYIYIKSHSLRILTNQLESSISQISTNLAHHIDTVDANLELFSDSDLLKKYMTADEISRLSLMQTPLIEQIRNYQNAYPNYSEVRIYLPDGEEDTRVLAPATKSVDRREHVEFMIKNKLDKYSRLLSNPDGSLSYLTIKALKLRSPETDALTTKPILRGYFLIVTQVDSIAGLLISVHESTKGYYFLTSHRGDEIYRPDEMALANESFYISEILGKRVSTVLKHQIGGKVVYGGYSRVNESLITLGLITEEDFESAATVLGNYFLWIVLVVLILSVFLIYSQVETLLINPINHLRKLVLRLKEGNLEQDISVIGNDELSELAEDFQSMSDSLAKSREKVNNLAYYDSLTGLPNRETFTINLKKSIAQCKRTDTALALLFIDLDNFKYINDAYGHAVGDQLLIETASRLDTCLRNADHISRQNLADDDVGVDMVVRLGGDEFTVVLADIQQAHQASVVAQRVINAVSQPYLIQGKEIVIGASIGIAMYPVDGGNAETIVKNADLAMYEAKQKGKNNFQFFTKALNSSVAHRMELESELRDALKQQQLFLQYQPKINLSNGVVEGVEALVRWLHPEKGMIPPNQFIPVAEDSGLILDVGRYTLKQACKQLKNWSEGGYSRLTIAVNISAAHLSFGDLVSDVRHAIEQYSVLPGNLEIEITESLLMRDERRGVETLRQLRELGVKLSLDDFGTGFSSLAYLRKIPLDSLKIDREFIQEMESNEDSAAIVKIIMDLAMVLNLEVVIEGVESVGQLEIIRRMGLPLIQGYYFCKPVGPEDIRLNYYHLIQVMDARKAGSQE